MRTTYYHRVLVLRRLMAVRHWFATTAVSSNERGLLGILRGLIQEEMLNKSKELSHPVWVSINTFLYIVALDIIVREYTDTRVDKLDLLVILSLILLINSPFKQLANEHD